MQVLNLIRIYLALKDYFYDNKHRHSGKKILFMKMQKYNYYSTK